MRPSKFRFPLRTDATTRSSCSIAFEMGGGRGPLFPMHVVQPYPTVWNPSASRKGVSPALEISGDRLRSGGEARLDPGPGLEPALHRAPGHDARAHHDRGVRG